MLIASNLLRVIGSPGRRARWLMLAAASGGLGGRLARNALLALASCDCSPGARIADDVAFPHPLGVVIGAGVTVGNQVTIYQNVTLGQDGRGGYPTIRQGACLMPGATICGAVTIGRNAIVGAGAFVDFDVPDDTTIAATFQVVAKPRARHATEWPNVQM